MNNMVSQPQLRILTWLNGYSSSLEKAWDVTRELSLPGISEGLGVVRSALNMPLKGLEQNGHLLKRMAHVVGGGSRRRQVYHITDTGREIVDNSVLSDLKESTTFKIFGTSPNLVDIFGRHEELSDCAKLLSNHSIIISGMPGIGKSAMVRSLCHSLSQKKTIRWATANEFTDYRQICQMWSFAGEMPSNLESITDLICSQDDEILVLDDYHLIDKRHLFSVNQMLNGYLERGKSKIIVITREMSVSLSEFKHFKMGPLDLESCCEMLGQDISLEVRTKIAESLGCHPLALNLYQPEFKIPEESSNVRDYVENIVLKNLNDNQKSNVSLLSIEPVAVDPNRCISNDNIDTFDTQGLLKWGENNRCEMQYLVRNVTRTNLSSSEKDMLHENLSNYWFENGETNEERDLYLYHLSKSNKNKFVETVEDDFEQIVDSSSNVIAVIVETLLQNHPTDKELRYIASKVSVHRSEPQELKQHLGFLDGIKRLEMDFKLAELEGRKEDCQNLANELIEVQSVSGKNRLLLSLISQIMDDRLPRESVRIEGLENVTTYLDMLDFSEPDKKRQALLVAVSVIRYSIALGEHNLESADNIMQSLIKLGSDRDPVVLSLETKLAIHQLDNDSKTIEEVCNLVEANTKLIDNLLLAESLKLRLVESLIGLDKSKAVKLFSQIQPPSIFGRSKPALRYSARWWLQNSEIDSQNMRSSLRESIVNYREAGCSNAAKRLESKFHALI